MTLKQKNKLLEDELQKAKDKIVNLQEDLKQEQLKRFESVKVQQGKVKDIPSSNRVRREQETKRWHP